ncbi:MAG TPA: Rv1355c family protein, partial [Cytophagaceae bacterium]|nr:Rv1355c family protein [Cytophagaceae bacterium]
ILENNIDIFFTQGGKLDLLVEESDGFDIKILSRYKARELRIPVIMEASDRCTVDVERFDREPNRSILHGTVDHLDIKTLKTLKTTEDKIPYLLDMVGLETSSSRLKASMLEIDQTITTWPQLSSSVTMGGGITADVSRRILLDTYTDSGRYHIDIEELIGNKKGQATLAQDQSFPEEHSLTTTEMKSLAASWNIDSSIHSKNISPANLSVLIEAAIQAPSGGNMQPWKWFYDNKKLFLFHDIERSSSLLDFDNLASYISLGAATENLILKAHQMNLEVSISEFPDPRQSKLIAIFIFFEKGKTPITSIPFESHQNDNLVSQLFNRSTNRTISERKNIDEKQLEDLQKVVRTIEGANLIVVNSPEKLKALGNIIAKTERIRLMNQRGHHDFVNEIRWTHQEAVDKRDGIDIATVDLSASEKAGFIVSKNWDVIQHLKKWKKGTAFEKLSRKAIESASAIGFITMPKHNHKNFFQGGRAVERAWLAASEMNLSFQPQSPATFFFARLMYGKGIELDPFEQKELSLLREQFITTMEIESDLGEIFMFRLCIADSPKVKSLRKNVTDVLFFND